jgi:hypothetical protein
VDHLRGRPCTTRSLAADPSDEFFQEEFIIQEATILYNEVDALRVTVIPLRQQCQEAEAKYRQDEHKRFREEDPEADQELGELELQQDRLRATGTALDQKLEDLREQFHPHVADELAQFIADQRVMIDATEKRVCNLRAECDQVRETHRLLVESQMHDTIEDNDIKISELSDRLEKLKLVEGVLEDEQRQSSDERDKAIGLAREAIVLQRKLKAMEYVREQRQLDLQNIERLHTSQKKAIKAALVQNQVKRDEDKARTRWRQKHHTRMEQFKRSSALYYAQREEEARAAGDAEAQRRPGQSNAQPVESVRLPAAEAPPRRPGRRRGARRVEDESRDQQEHRDDPTEPASDGAKPQSEESHRGTVEADDQADEAAVGDQTLEALASGAGSFDMAAQRVAGDMSPAGQQVAPDEEALCDGDTTTQPPENSAAVSAVLTGSLGEAAQEVVEETISEPAQQTTRETGYERKPSDASDHTPPVDERDGSVNELAEGSRFSVDEILESNEQDAKVDTIQEPEASEALPPNEEVPGEREADEAIPSGGLGDAMPVVAEEITESTDRATSEHDPETEQDFSGDATVRVTTGEQDDDVRCPADTSRGSGDVVIVAVDDIPQSNEGTDAAGGPGGGLGDVVLAPVDDIPHSNEGIAPEDRDDDVVAAQLPDDLIVASQAFVSAVLPSQDVVSQNGEASAGGAGGAFRATLTDELGEVISLFSVDLRGSRDLRNSGESRGLEHESDPLAAAEITAESDIAEHPIESEARAESNVAPDEIGDTAEAEIVAESKEAVGKVQHTPETEIVDEAQEPEPEADRKTEADVAVERKEADDAVDHVAETEFAGT